MHVGQGPPYTIRIVVSSDGDPDLSGAASAIIAAQSPSGVQFSWPAVVSSAAQKQATIDRVLQGSEFDRAGYWQLYASIATPSGTVRSSVVSLKVTPEFGT